MPRCWSLPVGLCTSLAWLLAAAGSSRADLLVCRAADLSSHPSPVYQPLDRGPDGAPAKQSTWQVPSLPLLALTGVIPWNMGQSSETTTSSTTTTVKTDNGGNSDGGDGGDGGGGTVAEVPEPTAVLLGLFGGGILGVGSLLNRRRQPE
jgi:hypothetical protein